MGEEKLKVAFRHFPREAAKEDDFFRNFLFKHFNIKESKEPDFVLFSAFTKEKGPRKMPELNGDYTKIFWTGENVRVDMKKCDYGFGFEYEEEINSDKYMRFPLYAYYGAGADLTKKKKASQIFGQKTKFCNYVYSKDTKERVAFFNALSKYKEIDSPGKSMNNSPPITSDNFSLIAKPLQKIEKLATKKHNYSALLSRHFTNWRKEIVSYQKHYKFSIAFENSSYPGYTTEKIYHPLLANSIPIYWGNPEINKDFNTKSFISFHKYNDAGKVIDLVIGLDTNEKKYEKMVSQPWFKNNEPNKWCGEERILRQFEGIFGVNAHG